VSVKRAITPPVHTVEPIILPPDPEPLPIIKPKPEIIKPKPIPKKRKKRIKKPKKKLHKKVIKKRPISPPILKQKVVEVVPQPEPQPVIEEVIAPVVTVDTTSIKDQYTSEIRRQIQKHLYYPKMAKRLRMQGVVRVAFRVLEDGRITQIRVINSSKKLLSKGAIKTLKALSLRPIPAALHEKYMDINIPIEFKLVKG
jgi:protein TonB